MEPIVYPSLSCPFPSAINPHAEQAQQATVAWARRFCLLQRDAAFQRLNRLQYGMLMARAEWVDTVVTMKPFWLVRTLSGISMDVGISLLVYNFMRTALESRPVAASGAGLRAPGESPVRA